MRSITGCSVQKFKSGVDKFLLTVPVEPPVPDCTARCWTYNTIKDQVDLRGWDGRVGTAGVGTAGLGQQGWDGSSGGPAWV